MRDPYSILGVGQNATESEITSAYRELAKKYHPDLNPNDSEAERKMQEINEAYDAIKRGNVRQNTYDSGAYKSYSEGNMSPLDSAESYLRMQMYEQAMFVLSSIEQRSARWYYLAAIAQSQAGSGITAMHYAETAVSMEPDNRAYREILEQLKTGEQAYFKRRHVISPLKGYPKFAVGAVLALLICKFCN